MFKMTVFDLYFAAIASLRYHPGAGALEHKQLSLEECAAEAARCCEIRKLYVKED